MFLELLAGAVGGLMVRGRPRHTTETVYVERKRKEPRPSIPWRPMPRYRGPLPCQHVWGPWNRRCEKCDLPHRDYLLDPKAIAKPKTTSLDITYLEPLI